MEERYENGRGLLFLPADVSATAAPTNDGGREKERGFEPDADHI